MTDSADEIHPANGIVRLECARCGETIGWEVPFGVAREEGTEYPTKLLHGSCRRALGWPPHVEYRS